jgi:hypothetical protein
MYTAYVDCAALDEKSADQVLQAAYAQWEEQVFPTRAISTRSRRRSRTNDKRLSEKQTKPVGMEDDFDEDRVEKYRSRGVRSRTERLVSRKHSEIKDDGGNSLETSQGVHTTVLTFGRLLKTLLRGRPAVLVLDAAERTLNLPPRKSSAKSSNLLGQLLQLSKCININLTIVLISSSILLEHARLNMVSSLQRSIGGLKASAQFVRVQFPAYKKKQVLKEILSSHKLQYYIVGGGPGKCKDPVGSSFGKALFNAFLGTLVQLLHESTVCITDFVRVGRLIWPKFTDPLRAENLERTLLEINGSQEKLQEWRCQSSHSSVLDYLGTAILAHARNFMEGVEYDLAPGRNSLESRTGSLGENVYDMPLAARYLLLSGFICQTNRPDRDRHVFSVERNGRRRKKATTENANAEDLAFGSSSQQCNNVRLRSFPQERLLSIFVSLLGLNCESLHQALSGFDAEESSNALGTLSLVMATSHLKEMNAILEQPARSPYDHAQMVEPRFVCSTTEGEARYIANANGFDLDRYLLH